MPATGTTAHACLSLALAASGDGTCQITPATDCGTAGAPPGNVGSILLRPTGVLNLRGRRPAAKAPPATFAPSRTAAPSTASGWARTLRARAHCCDQDDGREPHRQVDFDVNRQWSTFDRYRITARVCSTPARSGVLQRFTAWPEPVPFNLLDDSVSLFPGRHGWHHRATTWASSLNPRSTTSSVWSISGRQRQLRHQPPPRGFATATWTFDISGRSNISVQFDAAAAMGDFGGPRPVRCPRYDEGHLHVQVSIDGALDDDLRRPRRSGTSTRPTPWPAAACSPLDDPLVDQVSMVVLSNSFRRSRLRSRAPATLTLKFEG